MRYYSRKGDNGETSLYSGQMVQKDDPILEFIGTIDSLNSQIGFANSLTNQLELKKLFIPIQAINSKIMGMIAGADCSENGDLEFGDEIQKLEKMIQIYSQKVNPPQDFSFSGTTSFGAAIDICRVLTRKVERKTVTYMRENPSADKCMIAFYNRLSSLFFVLRLFVDQTFKN